MSGCSARVWKRGEQHAVGAGAGEEVLPGGVGVFHVVGAAGARGRIFEPLEPGVGAAFAHPRRHGGVEARRGGVVGVHVGGDVDAGGARRLDASDGVVELAPVLPCPPA